MIKSIDSTHLHLQVRKLLLQEITQGEFATLDMLPTEMELCERLGVSRTTLRHSVTALEQRPSLAQPQRQQLELATTVVGVQDGDLATR